MKNKVVKKVNAWAIIYDSVAQAPSQKGKIETADYFVDYSCPAQDETKAMAIYESKKEARFMLSAGSEEHKIVPCEITFTLPVKKKAK